MTIAQYLLKRAILGREPETVITEAEYLDMRRCRKCVYEAFEIELAFDFIVQNYIDIEKFVAEHLVNDMVGGLGELDAFRTRQWEFIRVFSNWLASVTFWHDLTRNRLISICGRGSELKQFETAHKEIAEKEFEYGLIVHLRNYSQHVGFPLSGFSTGGSWNENRTELTYTSSYYFDYEHFRPYIEAGGRGAKARKAFGKRIEAYNGGERFDLKPIIRRSMSVLGLFMDRVRECMETQVSRNEELVLEMIQRYESDHPQIPDIVGLSLMPVDKKGVVANKADIIPVLDEFIHRARQLRRKNNASALSVERRIISNV